MKHHKFSSDQYDKNMSLLPDLCFIAVDLDGALEGSKNAERG